MAILYIHILIQICVIYVDSCIYVFMCLCKCSCVTIISNNFLHTLPTPLCPQDKPIVPLNQLCRGFMLWDKNLSQVPSLFWSLLDNNKSCGHFQFDTQSHYSYLKCQAQGYNYSLSTSPSAGLPGSGRF